MDNNIQKLSREVWDASLLSSGEGYYDAINRIATLLHNAFVLQEVRLHAEYEYKAVLQKSPLDSEEII